MRGARAIAVALVVSATACGGTTTESTRTGTEQPPPPPPPPPPGDSSSGNAPLIVGADLSSLAAVEHGGAVFSDGGVPGDAIAILKRDGFNYVRLRLFHSPEPGRELVNDLSYDLALAQRVKAAGLGFLLDIQYSDTWADPGAQTKPRAWSALDFATLRDSVFAYTRDVAAAFRAAGAAPDMIQVGNEVNVGMLWPDGFADSLDAGWERFAELVQAGRDGARAGLAGAPVLFLHHVADPANVVWHLDNLLRFGDAPDVIGVSYYPFWHGDLAGFAAHMAAIAARYGKPVVVVETAYPWTNDYHDAYADVYHGQPPAGMPAYTPGGQRDYVTQMIAALRRVPDGRGTGFFWWEPAWLPGAAFGSPVDNLTLFDQHGAALPALDAIRAATSPARTP